MNTLTLILRHLLIQSLCVCANFPSHPFSNLLYPALCLEANLYAAYKQGWVPSNFSWFGQWRAPVGDMSEEKWEKGHYFPGSLSLSAESLVWLWPSVRNHWSLIAHDSTFRFQKSSHLPKPLGQKLITAPVTQALGYCPILPYPWCLFSPTTLESLFINEPRQAVLF